MAACTGGAADSEVTPPRAAACDLVYPLAPSLCASGLRGSPARGGRKELGAETSGRKGCVRGEQRNLEGGGSDKPLPLSQEGSPTAPKGKGLMVSITCFCFSISSPQGTFL